jgi:hypothetical protein
MATIEPTKADLLRAIETEQDWWLAMIDTARTSGPLTGDEDIDGDWTFKELLAHIDGWRSWTLARFEAAADGTDPKEPWPAEMHEESDDDVDAINAWFKEQSHRQSLDDVIAASTNRLHELHAVLERMSEDDLFTPGRFVRFGAEYADLPIGPAVLGYSITHVHGEHGPTLETWLSARSGQHVELPPTPPNFGYDD